MTHFTNAPVDERYEVHQRDPAAFATIRVGPAEGRYDEHILTQCHAYELEPALAKAVMKAESGFDPHALSNKGAIGLMQLMPETAQRLGVADPWDPAENIEGGIKYLSTLVRQFGSVELAAAAYNAGENAVIKYGGIPPYAETQNYVKSVRTESGVLPAERLRRRVVRRHPQVPRLRSRGRSWRSSGPTG